MQRFMFIAALAVTAIIGLSGMASAETPGTGSGAEGPIPNLVVDYTITKGV
jgi:hypothetical protein